MPRKPTSARTAMRKIFSFPNTAPSGRRARRGETLVFGGAYKGTATPSKYVPYEPPKGPDAAAQRREREQRARDVADAYEHRRNELRARERFG
jgi:hypothetical protein